MSNNVKRQKRGYSQPLVERTQRVRTSRHGKPHMRRKGGGRRVVWTDKGAVIMRESGTLVAVTEPFAVQVAAGPTATYGDKNTGGANAGKKSAKPA